MTAFLILFMFRGMYDGHCTEKDFLGAEFKGKLVGNQVGTYTKVYCDSNPSTLTITYVSEKVGNENNYCFPRVLMFLHIM